MSENNNKTNYELDELDMEILSQLQQDGRKSFKDISDSIGAPVSTIRSRYARLIESKTLQVIGRVVPDRVGFNVFTSILIEVRPSKMLNSVVEKIQDLPEVSYLALVSGPHDILLDVMCRDNDHLMNLMENQILNIDGVYHTELQTHLRVIGWRQPDYSLIQKKRNGNDN
jgi:Lrp/AsnC family transcriptional regulator for asnA, asnC and gidA